MGEVGSESARNLEWDLIQRVLARLWNSGSLPSTGLSRRTEQPQNQISRIARGSRALYKVPLQPARRASQATSPIGRGSKSGEDLKNQPLESFKHRFHSQQCFVIPEPHHPKSLSIEKRGPPFIIFPALEMLRAVQLDDQLFIYAAKIDDIPADWMLSSELETAELVGAKFAPERILGIALITPQPSRLIALQPVQFSFFVKHAGNRR